MRYKLNKISHIEFSTFGIEGFQVRQPSLVDSFHFSHGECCDTGEKTCTYHNPLYMLFNQERLDRLGEGAVRMWMQQLDAAGNTAYSSLKSKLSDDDMLKLVKSRHIQHPSELESWLNYLDERADLCNSEIQKIIQMEKEKQESSEPSDIDMNELNKT